MGMLAVGMPSWWLVWLVSLVLQIFLFCFDCLLLLMLLALGKKDILICSCVWWCKKAGKQGKARTGFDISVSCRVSCSLPIGIECAAGQNSSTAVWHSHSLVGWWYTQYQNRGAGLRMARAWAAARSTVPSPRVNQGNRSLVCACAWKWTTVRVVSAPGASGHSIAWHGMA